MTARDQGNQVRHATRGRGQINALVWSILKSQDEDEIAHRVAQWYEGDERRAGLQGLDFETSLRARDWEGAKARLERHFGRYHPHYKPAMDILMAACQCRRMLLAHRLQHTLDGLMSSGTRSQSL